MKSKKMSVAWHRECLVNKEKYHHRMELELLRITDIVERSRANIRRLKIQIQGAERQGLTEFDGERFGLKGN